MNDASASQPLQGIDHVREQFHNLHEFVSVARAKLDRNVWDYLIGGAETETTVRRNRLALDSLAFRPRVLRDVNGTDTSTTFLGRKIAMPVALASIRTPARPSPMPPAPLAARCSRARWPSPTSSRPARSSRTG
jgi:glycolate oxidase